MADDPFAILGLPRRYAIDRAALQRAYLAKSAGVHPDAGLADHPADDGPDAAAVNLAKQTLEDPEKRAHALLRLLAAEAGVKFKPEEDRALPPGFLMEMMQTREQMEADRAAADAAGLARWEQWAESRRREHEAKVARMFDAAPMPDAAALLAIKQELNAWRYVERMIEQIGEA